MKESLRTQDGVSGNGNPSIAVDPKPIAVEQPDTVNEDPPDTTTKRFVLVLYQEGNARSSRPDASIGYPLVAEVCTKMKEADLPPKEDVEIDIWLESPGGDAHAAYKLALLLRAHARLIRVVVPDYAKSAATLLALAADEIYMAPSAELGPLDAQLPNEGGMITQISALDIARSLDDLTSSSLRLALDGATVVVDLTRLSRKDSLEAMLDFSAKFMAPIVQQLDPAMIHFSSTLLKVSIAYAERLLDMRTTGRDANIRNLPRMLVENYPTHGFVIGAVEAATLGLPIHDIGEYDLAEAALHAHSHYELSRIDDLRFVPAETFMVTEDKDTPDGGTDETQEH